MVLHNKTCVSNNSSLQLNSNAPDLTSKVPGNRCLVCAHKCSTLSSHINSTNPEIVNDWKESPATTFCSIFALDPNKYHSSLTKGLYCTDCCQILFNLDYTFKKIVDLQQILDNDKTTLLQLVSAHYKLSQTMKKSRENVNHSDLDPTLMNIIPMLVNELNLNCSTIPLWEEIKLISSDIESDDDFFAEDSYSIINNNPCKKFISGREDFMGPSFSISQYDNYKCEDHNHDTRDTFLGRSKDGNKVEVLVTRRRGGTTSHFSRKANFTCASCPNNTFKTHGTLSQHIRTVHMGRRLRLYKCEAEECAQKFVRTSELNNHYQIEHPVMQRTVNCDECTNIYFTKVQLQKHKESRHSKVDYKCAHCDRTFNNPTKRKSHEAIHATSRDFLCSACVKDFKSKKFLGIHKYLCPNRTESLTPAVIKRCEARCSSRYSKSPNLHICCKICLLRFSNTVPDTKENLELHEALHMLKAPIICCVVPSCPISETFSNVTELQAHVREFHYHEPTTGPNWTTCEVCSKTFIRENLNRHMKNCHAEHLSRNSESMNASAEQVQPTGETISKPVVMQYCQENCGLGFPTYGKLLRHRKEMQHNGNRIKTYICDICGAGYTFPQGLKDHMVGNHSENPQPKFQCKICGKLFMRGSILSRHKEVHDSATIPCPNCGKCFGVGQKIKQHKDFYCPNRQKNVDGIPIKKRKIYSRSQKLKQTK